MARKYHQLINTQHDRVLHLQDAGYAVGTGSLPRHWSHRGER